jgi:hypothetical protein
MFDTLIRRFWFAYLSTIVIVVAGCSEHSEPATQRQSPNAVAVPTKDGAAMVSVVGFSPFGKANQNGRPARYSIDGTSVGEGADGYRRILAKLRRLPLGTTVELRREVGVLVSNDGQGGEYVGGLSAGPNPFAVPGELLAELKRIGSERHLQLIFNPPIEENKQ